MKARVLSPPLSQSTNTTTLSHTLLVEFTSGCVWKSGLFCLLMLCVYYCMSVGVSVCGCVYVSLTYTPSHAHILGEFTCGCVWESGCFCV